ncbi:nose resistant to fluoxetine protein 6-like [Aedes aegypti]|uniref:Acyltransferase 3 domain-containing protein n=1 Tax=Aedes aegypti TaxID=7159 RepID=A0A903VCK7_AEDAE|nr:nose resistant to fluoxetine protein 6-like [Aedes aegypti]
MVFLEDEPWKMQPQLYDYDDFDDCRRRNPSFRYNVVKAHIVQNTSSVMWQRITQHSNDPRHYQRNALEIGICLDRCKWATNVEMSIEQQAGICAADRVWTNYQLKSIPETLVSISADDYDRPVGTLEMIFCLTVLSIVLLIVTCTIIDFQGIYTESLVVKAFSLSGNLKKLGSLNSRSRQDLLFLDGIRVLTMLTIVLCHASIPMIRMPLKNPEKMEQQFSMFWFPIAMAGNTYLVQIFFVIGGVVLAVNFMDHIKTHPQFKMWYLMDRILNRLVRILPVYSFVILFQVSWYNRLKNGPIAERYQDHCMENWWTNLLFVNNYIEANKPCLQFTWYLGADFQLFLVGTIILMFIWRFPKFINASICFMVIFALVVPAAVIYFNNLDATVMMIVRYVIDEIRNLDYYLKVYVTFESNAGNYFFGVVTGIVYHHFVEHGKTLEDIQHFSAMFLSAVAFFVTLNTLTMCLPLDHPAEPSLILALYGSLFDIYWYIIFGDEVKQETVVK